MANKLFVTLIALFLISSMVLCADEAKKTNKKQKKAKKEAKTKKFEDEIVDHSLSLQEYIEEYNLEESEAPHMRFVKEHFPTPESTLNKKQYGDLLWHLIANHIADEPHIEDDHDEIMAEVKVYVQKFLLEHEKTEYNYQDAYHHHFNGEFNAWLEAHFKQDL